MSDNMYDVLSQGDRAERPVIATSMRREFRELHLLIPIAVANWAIGTNWLGTWWYPVTGVSWVDLLFIAWLLVAMLEPHRAGMLGRSLWHVRQYATLMCAFVAVLFTSAAVNAYRFGAQWNDIPAILRLLYFVAIIVVVHAYVTRWGYTKVAYSFIVGIVVLGLERLYIAQTAGSVMLAGLPVLRDPNVIGNLVGVAVFFCSFGILAGHTRWPLALALILSAVAVLTFSKGAWLMVLIGLAANAVAVLMMRRVTAKAERRRLFRIALMFVAVLFCLINFYFDTLQELVLFKLFTTVHSETAAYRYQFALAALQAMADYPIFGLGFRNYGVVESLYPELMPEPSENAHSAFLQIAAVAGVPGLLVLLILFAYPFLRLWKALRWHRARMLAGTYVTLACALFGLSGAVQLQLIAQPFFWIFTGIVFGWSKAKRVPSSRVA